MGKKKRKERKCPKSNWRIETYPSNLICSYLRLLKHCRNWFMPKWVCYPASCGSRHVYTFVFLNMHLAVERREYHCAHLQHCVPAIWIVHSCIQKFEVMYLWYIFWRYHMHACSINPFSFSIFFNYMFLFIIENFILHICILNLLLAYLEVEPLAC